jgi:hypothetical protein
MNEPGVLEERILPSRTDPGKDYLMVRTAGGWQHIDASCDAWAVTGHCYHVEALNMEENGDNTTAVVQFERAEDRAIVARISGQITTDWVYRFKVGQQEVTGLSVDGVEAAARECAKLGEAIRELDVRCEYEDENEARFVARAGRYVVGPDGSERLLDVAIRGKRQPKVIRLRSGGTQADEFWYEIGVAKAVRNAKEALLPEAVKAEIMAKAETSGRVQRVEGPQQAPRTQRRPSPAEREAAAQPMMGTIDQMITAAKGLGFKDEGEVLAALGYISRMQIGDVQADFGRLRQLAQEKAKA